MNVQVDVNIYIHCVNYFLGFYPWLLFMCQPVNMREFGFFFRRGGRDPRKKNVCQGRPWPYFWIKRVIFSGRGLCKKCELASLSTCNIHLKDQCSEGRIYSYVKRYSVHTEILVMKISRRYTQLRYVIYETIKILFLVIDAGIKEASIAENTQKPHSLYESSNIGFFCLSKLTK